MPRTAGLQSSGIAPRAFAVSALLLGACPGPQHPREEPPGSVTQAVGRPGLQLRGVAADRAHAYASLSDGSARRTTIEAWHGGQVEWRTVISGDGGPLARTKEQIVAAITAGEPAVRGEPGAQVVGLSQEGGSIAWTVSFGSTEWSLVSALAPMGPDVIVGGSFAGTLRAADHVVSSGGRADAFLARITPAGQVAWLIRLGGPGPDAIQGVAVAGERIAITGTFVAGADLQGRLLSAYDERLPFSDIFVAELDASGKRVWAETYGSRNEDAVAGVAIDAQGRIAVAGSIRESMRIDGVEHSAQGLADGLVVWLTAKGDIGPVQLVGGREIDGLSGIATLGDGVLIAGFYSGRITIGGATFVAGGGDGAFLAAIDPQGTRAAWDLAGEGREEVTALGAMPSGFVAGLATTDAITLDGAPLPAGTGMVVRPAGP